MRRLVPFCFALSFSLACSSPSDAAGTAGSDPIPDKGMDASAGATPARDPAAGANAPASHEGGSAASNDGAASVPPVASQMGSVELTLAADKGASNVVVSTGLPFAAGKLMHEAEVVVRDAAKSEVPVQVTVLARWPRDGSIRSVLVAFRATLSAGATATYRVDYGTPRTLPALTNLAPNPDGPITATFPAKWYSASGVSGMQVAVADDHRFAKYEASLEQSLWNIDYSAYGNNCPTTSQHRTYYDGPHSLYQLFLRTGDPKHLRRAREEALWYRTNELAWYSGRAMAVQSCQAAGWTPSVVLDQSVIRRMLGQGMLDDYLLTGDPAAREALVGLGEAYRQDLPALTSGTHPAIEITERNLAWTMMGLASYYAVDPRAEVRDALTSLMDRIIAWQARGTSGALEHDIMRADPSECEDGPQGGSPFMTSLVVDAIMDYVALTGDARATEVVRKLAVWYETKAITSDHQAFRYLWNCTTDSYDDSGVADLNLLIVHVFGAAYTLTKDLHWLTVGDAIADAGVNAMSAKAPKQWDQAARSFGRYLGYRAAGVAP